MEEKKKGFFCRLVDGLTKTRENIVSGMDSIFSAAFQPLTRIFMRRLEETLIMGDLGIQTTMSVAGGIKKGREGAAHQGSGPVPPGALIDSIRKTDGPGRKRV